MTRFVIAIAVAILKQDCEPANRIKRQASVNCHVMTSNRQFVSDIMKTIVLSYVQIYLLIFLG